MLRGTRMRWRSNMTLTLQSTTRTRTRTCINIFVTIIVLVLFGISGATVTTATTASRWEDINIASNRSSMMKNVDRGIHTSTRIQADSDSDTTSSTTPTSSRPMNTTSINTTSNHNLVEMIRAEIDALLLASNQLFESLVPHVHVDINNGTTSAISAISASATHEESIDEGKRNTNNNNNNSHEYAMNEYLRRLKDSIDDQLQNTTALLSTLSTLSTLSSHQQPKPQPQRPFDEKINPVSFNGTIIDDSWRALLSNTSQFSFAAIHVDADEDYIHKRNTQMKEAMDKVRGGHELARSYVNDAIASLEEVKSKSSLQDEITLKQQTMVMNVMNVMNHYNNNNTMYGYERMLEEEEEENIFNMLDISKQTQKQEWGQGTPRTDDEDDDKDEDNDKDEDDKSIDDECLLGDDVWTKAGYMDVESISNTTVSNEHKNIDTTTITITSKTPKSQTIQMMEGLSLERYKLRNDAKKDILISTGRLKSGSVGGGSGGDEARTRTHIGVREFDWSDIVLKLNQGDTDTINTNTRTSMLDDSNMMILYYNLRAISDIAHDVDRIRGTIKALGTLLKEDDSEITSTIRRIQEVVVKDNNEHFESIVELAARSAMLETDVAVNKIMLQSMDMKRMLREDVENTKYEKEMNVLDSAISSQLHMVNVREQMVLHRSKHEIERDSVLSSVLDILHSVDGYLANANSTSRDVELIIKSGSVEAANERARIQAEASEERKQEQFSLEKIKVMGEEAKANLLQMIETIFNHLVQGLGYMISEEDGRKQAIMFAVSTTLLVFSLSIAKEVMSLLFLFLLRSLSMPRLVRHWGRGRRGTGVSSSNERIKEVKFPPKEKKRIEELCNVIQLGRERRAPLRNILLHGHAGTGKSLTARAIAESSQLPYAVISGSDIAPLGCHGPSELRRVLMWARSRRRGGIVIIDEAESALGKRIRGGDNGVHPLSKFRDNNKTMSASSVARDALNVFLALTGESGGNFMLILTTTNPSALDEAVLDRCDDVICCCMPSMEQRKAILQKELDVRFKAQTNGINNLTSKIQNMLSVPKAYLRYSPTFNVNGAVEKLSKEPTATFSGRELSKIIRAVESSVFASDDCILTRSLWDQVVTDMCRNIKAKKKLQKSLLC